MSMAIKGNSEGEMLGMHPACSMNVYRRSMAEGTVGSSNHVMYSITETNLAR